LRLLLDTHVLVWWLTDAAELPGHMRELITTADNDVFVSAVSCWEIAVKVRAGKWPEASGLVPGFAEIVSAAQFSSLPVTIVHAEAAGLLDIPHKDPFDRMLAVQAMHENMKLLSVDAVFQQIVGLDVH
jgi:PIN domain nuclease of toxin-antitoxin system